MTTETTETTTDAQNETKRSFEVGVEGLGREFEHITVEASSAAKAFKKAENEAKSLRYDLEKPLNAYQAFEIGKGVTHYP